MLFEASRGLRRKMSGAGLGGVAEAGRREHAGGPGAGIEPCGRAFPVIIRMNYALCIQLVDILAASLNNRMYKTLCINDLRVFLFLLTM